MAGFILLPSGTGMLNTANRPVTAAPDLPTASSDLALLERAADAAVKLRRAIAETIIGQEDVIEAMLVTLSARGHALLVGVPGLAKTLLVSSLAQALDLSFGRVQFTPDLLPADITGTDVLQETEADGDPARVRRRLKFLQGPIFANLILADEINRTPPKTQAALLQAMQERKVTVGTTTHALPDPFQVFATRNPIEQEGTYPLPEAQLDRFLLEIHVDYPSEKDEMEVARRTTSGAHPALTPVLRTEDVRALGALVPRIPATDEAIELAVKLARATRPEGSVVGPRGARLRAFRRRPSRQPGAGARRQGTRGAARGSGGRCRRRSRAAPAGASSPPGAELPRRSRPRQSGRHLDRRRQSGRSVRRRCRGSVPAGSPRFACAVAWLASCGAVTLETGTPDEPVVTPARPPRLMRRDGGGEARRAAKRRDHAERVRQVPTRLDARRCRRAPWTVQRSVSAAAIADSSLI